MTTTIYKLCPRDLWQAAERLGRFTGSAVDLEDGFIHFSTAGQVRETADRHFRGVADLLLVAVDVARLGKDLRWEPSRGGALFPHLYAPLSLPDVRSIRAVPLTPDSRHDFSRVLP